MDDLHVGDVVTYLEDWKPNRKWYLYSLHGDGLCTIVIIRDGKISNTKGNEERLNASIVNLDIKKVKRFG